MIDPNHPYTLHHTYTGKGCAMCGKEASAHKQDYWMVEGEKKPVPQESGELRMKNGKTQVFEGGKHTGSQG